VWGAPLDDARRLLSQGRTADAHRVVSAYLEANPSDREGRFMLANILAQEGRLDAAYAVFQELVAQDPDDPVGTAIRRLFADRGATARDAVRVQGLFQEAQRAVQERRVDDARRALEEVVALAPGNFAGRNNLAQLLERMGRDADAVPHLEILAKARPRDIGLLNHLAGVYERMGNVDEAVRTYERVLKLRATNPVALMGLGRLYLFARKDYAVASDFFRKVLEANPEQADAAYLLGASRNEAGDTAGATEAFQRAVAIDPAYYRAEFELGKIYEAAGREAEALKAFESTVRHGGTSPEAEQSRRRLALFGTSPEIARQVRADLNLGVKALEAGDLEAAKAAFQRVLTLVPDNTLALYNLATVYTRQGNNDLAIESLKAAVASDETHFLSHYGLALAYVGLGRFEDAFEEYRQVLRWSPEDSPYHADAKAKVDAVEKILAEYATRRDARDAFVKGNALAAEGKPKEALEQYQRAIELDPENPYYHYNAGIIQGDLGNFGEAFKAFREAVRLKPDHIQSHFRLGLFYAATGFPQQAIESFRQVLRYGTDEPEVAEARKRIQASLAAADGKEKALAYLLLGNALVSAGEDDKALFAFRQAHRLNPEHPGIAQRLVEVLLQGGHDDEALQVAQTVLEAKPVNPRLWFYVGQIEAKAGRMEEAIQALRTSTEQSPDLVSTYLVLAKTLVDAGRAGEAVETMQDFVGKHPDNEAGVLGLGRLLRDEKRPAEAAALYDWYLASHPETTELLVERGLMAVATGAGGLPEAPPTGTALAGILTGAEAAAGTPRYRTPTEWFERAIAIAGPQDGRFVTMAQQQIAQSKRLRMNIAQTVIDYNTNGNNSATAPLTGVRSSATLSLTYLSYRSEHLSIPVVLSSAHNLHYTFQTYVNTDTVSVQLATSTRWLLAIPEVSWIYVRTQRGSVSKRYVAGGNLQARLPFPRTLSADYRRTDLTSFTNVGNNYLQDVLDLRVGHNFPAGFGVRMNLSARYIHRVLDAVALSLDTDRTDLTYSLSASRSLPKQRSVSLSGSYTDSENVRSANIRPGSTTGEVVPILSHTAGGTLSYTFRVYPTVSATLSGSYSVTRFTQGVFSTFTPEGGGDPVTVETPQSQTSLSFGVAFTYRPDPSTTWVLDIRQVEARATQDTPANLEDVLTDQVVQDNINQRRTINLRMNYAF